jgi:hypothetical protein
MTTTLVSAISLVAGLALPMALLAQDLPVLRDDQLLVSIGAATEAADAAGLLALMQEARGRGLLMFNAGKTCNADIPDTGVLSSEINRGAVTWAYHMRVWDMALTAGHCGCATDLLSFAQFTSDITGHAPEDLTAADVGTLRQFWQDQRREIEPAYAAFAAEACARP